MPPQAGEKFTTIFKLTTESELIIFHAIYLIP